MVRGLEVRKATIDDIEKLAVLFDGYRQFYEQPSNLEKAHSFLLDRLQLNESTVFIALNDSGEGVGFTQLYPMFSSVRMRRIWILNDLFVSPTARKQGVGAALMQAATAFATSQGAAGLELATAKDNTSAKSVYEALGWEMDTEFDHYSITIK